MLMPHTQLLYQGHPTFKSQLHEMFESGEADAYTKQELAHLIGCSFRTVATYELDWIRDRLADGDYFSPDVADDVMELRTVEKLTFAEIQVEVNDRYGISLTHHMILQLYRSRTTNPPVIPVEIDDADLPLETTRGTIVVWCGECRETGDCGECDFEELCKELVKDGCFVACERPLQKELLETYAPA